MQKLILASSSPYRRQLLDSLKLSYTCHSPEIDETPHTDEPVSELVQRLAFEKCRAVAEHYPDSLIIGSDQSAMLKGQFLSKPHTTLRACEQLSRCSGETVTFHTGLCLYDGRDNSYQCEDITFKVHFRALSEREISNYVALEQPLNCAGSFKVEGLGISLFEKLEGDDHNSLIGLPLISLLNMLRNKGVSPLTL
ncbi:MAG: Maf family protein [Pseudomonadales bacterium]